MGPVSITATAKSVLCRLLLVGAICVCSISIAADPSEKQLVAKLEELCLRHDLPGMAVAVVNADGLVESHCFGIRKRETSDKIELSDRFALGSNTKAITAALAACLVEAGKIEWKTTIGEAFPKLTEGEIHPKLRVVTLDQLLSHQSGLAANISDISSQAWVSFFQEKLSPTLEREQLLKLVLPNQPKLAPEKFNYSNLGYAVACAMLETRAGEPYESLVKKYVFDPLEMNSADFRSMRSAKQLKPPLLWGHAANGDPVDPRAAGSENPTVYAAAGTVHVTIEDYAKFVHWQLVGKPEPVLKTQQAFDRLHEPLVDFTTPGSKYGRGWICINGAFGPAVSHTGSNTNSFVVTWILPKRNFAVIVCTNSGQTKALTACNELVTQLMKSLAK